MASLVGNLWSVGPDASSHLRPPRARGCDLVWCWPVLGALEGSSSQIGEGGRGDQQDRMSLLLSQDFPLFQGLGKGSRSGSSALICWLLDPSCSTSLSLSFAIWEMGIKIVFLTLVE